jgi:hypothetical protein
MKVKTHLKAGQVVGSNTITQSNSSTVEVTQSNTSTISGYQRISVASEQSCRVMTTYP